MHFDGTINYTVPKRSKSCSTRKGQETSEKFCGYNLHICPMNSQMADSTGPRAFPLSEKLVENVSSRQNATEGVLI